MIVSDNLYKVDTSQKASERINHLNKRRSQLIAARSHISKKMAKGYLDYVGISKEAWEWRFQSVYTEGGEQNRIDEMTGDAIDTPVKRCKFLSAEELNKRKYIPLEIVRDKVDDYTRDVTSREFELETLSVPYHNQRYIISHLVKEPYKTPEFRDALKQVVFDAAVKSTGFLRPVIYNIEKKISQPVVKEVGGRNSISFETTTEKTRVGLKLEAVDPETVFVDPAATEPKECFIITPYEVEELVNRFPMLEEYIPELTRLGSDNQKAKKGLLKKESLYNYHIAELLEEVYELADLNFLYYLNSSYFPDGNFSNYGAVSKGFQEFESNGRNLLFGDGNASAFYENALNFSLPEDRKRKSYFVTEYYNLNPDKDGKTTYCVYIGDILLLETQVMEPFNDLPLVPIYVNKKKRGYYGTALTEYFSNFQDEYNEDNHAQRLATAITGKPLLLINDSAISSIYHPDKQIVIEKSSPITTIHVTEMSIDNGINMGSPITPINTTTGTAENILASRKAEVINNMERQFPSIKTLSAASSPEAQKDIMWSRDLLTNNIISEISISLEKLAYKVFPSRLLELKLLSKDLNISIPVFEGSPNEVKIRVESTDAKVEKAQEDRIKELTQLYKDQVDQVKEQIKQDPNMGGQITQQVIGQISNEVVGQFLQNSGSPLPEDPEQLQVLIQQAAQDPQIKQVIDEQIASTGEQLIDAQLTDMAMKQVEPPQDLDMYFSFQTLKELSSLQKAFKFSFKRSQKEIQAAMNNFIQTIKPFEQFTPYNIQLTEFLKMAIENAGYNPNQMLVDKPPTPIDISRAEQTRLTEIVSYDKIPAVFARFLNDKAGQEIFSEDTLIASMEKMLNMETQIKAQEIQVRGQVKAQTNMIQESNKVQLNAEMSNADIVRNQVISEASQPQINI